MLVKPVSMQEKDSTNINGYFSFFKQFLINDENHLFSFLFLHFYNDFKIFLIIIELNLIIRLS